jgi:hypothetical protein
MKIVPQIPCSTSPYTREKLLGKFYLGIYTQVIIPINTNQ